MISSIGLYIFGHKLRDIATSTVPIIGVSMPVLYDFLVFSEPHALGKAGSRGRSCADAKASGKAPGLLLRSCSFGSVQPASARQGRVDCHPKSGRRPIERTSRPGRDLKLARPGSAIAAGAAGGSGDPRIPIEGPDCARRSATCAHDGATAA